MLYDYTLREIRNNTNPGVEYEIALFYALLSSVNQSERKWVSEAIEKREDAAKIKDIISYTDIIQIELALQNHHLSLEDVSFETQNDGVGPSDVVMRTRDYNGNIHRIGLSIKFANTCTSNVSGRNFITEEQRSELKNQLSCYVDRYIKEMTEKYKEQENWFRKRKPSSVTDEYIDLLRGAVIDNWEHVENKQTLFGTLFHSNSPIEFWVVTYRKRNYTLNITPPNIDMSRVDDITAIRYKKSYVDFYLGNTMIGRMQVKFNNGILEKSGKYGRPFDSWNFSLLG